MASLSDNELKKINSDIKSNKVLLTILISTLLALVVFISRGLFIIERYLVIFSNATSTNNLSDLSGSSEFISMSAIIIPTLISQLAFLFSILAVDITMILSYYDKHTKLNDKLKDDELKKEEDEIKRIENSISLFYVPLQNLLTIHDKSGSDEVKLKILNEINGYKYLAEHRVQFLFEIYKQRNEESQKISRKLLYLVCRDIEDLQNQLTNEQ